MTEVKYHAMGNAFVTDDNQLSGETHPLNTTYVAEARRRIARATVLWLRGGDSRHQIKRMRRIGKYLRKVREDLELTRAELANRTNLATHFLLLIEGGLVSPEELERVIDRLAEGLGKTPSELHQAFESLENHHGTHLG